jgi:flagellar hook assembly protein FlgD
MIDLTIFDINGKKVRTLLHETMPPGNFAVRWDGTDSQGRAMASGIYFYRLNAGNKTLSGKMTFLK